MGFAIAVRQEDFIAGGGSLVTHLLVAGVLLFLLNMHTPLPKPVPKEVKVVQVRPQPIDLNKTNRNISVPKLNLKKDSLDSAKNMLRNLPTDMNIPLPPDPVVTPPPTIDRAIIRNPLGIAQPAQPPGGPLVGFLRPGPTNPAIPDRPDFDRRPGHMTNPNMPYNPSVLPFNMKIYENGGYSVTNTNDRKKISREVGSVFSNINNVVSGSGSETAIAMIRRVGITAQPGIQLTAGDVEAKVVHDKEMGIPTDNPALSAYSAPLKQPNGKIGFKKGKYHEMLSGRTISISMPAISSMGGAGRSSIEIFQDVKSAYENLAGQVQRRTGMKVDLAKKIPLSDAKILDSPILILDDIRQFSFTHAERNNIREFVDRGKIVLINARHYDAGTNGFLYHIKYEFKKILKDEYDVVDIPKDHTIFNSFYDLRQGTVPSRWASIPITGIYVNDRLSIIICQNSYTNSIANEDMHHPTPSGTEMANQLLSNILVYAQLRQMGKVF